MIGIRALKEVSIEYVLQTIQPSGGVFHVKPYRQRINVNVKT